MNKIRTLPKAQRMAIVIANKNRKDIQKLKRLALQQLVKPTLSCDCHEEYVDGRDYIS